MNTVLFVNATIGISENLFLLVKLVFNTTFYVICGKNHKPPCDLSHQATKKSYEKNTYIAFY